MAQPAATDDELEDGVEAQPTPGRGKKILIIVVVLLLVLAGGGFAAFKMMGGKEDPKKKEAVKKEQLLPARYVTLDPPFVVNFQAESTVRFLQITIGIMTRDVEVEKLIKDNDPRIRNDLLLILGNQSYESVSKLEGKEDLRARSLEAVRAVVKDSGGEPNKVEALYFTSFVMQ
ncbi:MAG TPA: flagellar basal body-associated FliL family protein [Steroidobacteraceae bacterium]|nr:flagellar basal body-associated FliL family protein [Steroidobacteraceae bacterium]